MEPQKHQFIVHAVPCFGDVSDTELTFCGMPKDASREVYNAVTAALAKVRKTGATSLCCTVDRGVVTVDILDQRLNRSCNKLAVC